MMRNCFFVISVMLAAGAGSIACSGDDSPSSPLQPTPLATAPSGAGPQQGLAGPGGLPAGAGGEFGEFAQLAPPPDEFNAYSAQIEYVDGEVTITFVPVDMPRMPDAAREYRNRAVTVRHCPVEPHHVGQQCGEPVFTDSFAFLGSPSRTFTLPDCAGWLTIEAAELSADRYAGWRNAPLSCRTDEQGRTVASVDTDGAGDGWKDNRFDPPPRQSGPEPVRNETVQGIVDAAIADAGGLAPGRDPVNVVDVEDLFEDTEGATGDQYSATSSDETVATVAITDNPRVVVTPVGPGKATIRITALESGERVEFDVTVGEPGNSAPAITNPGNREYMPGQTIEAFSVEVRDADGDGVTVGVSGLPAGLTSPEASGDGTVSARVSGTVAADAEARAYTVTVTANDGVNDPVTATFTITVTANRPPAITPPANVTYMRGDMITPFSIEVRDADGDDVTVDVSGLPEGLEWSAETKMVSGTVAADAALQPYTVTVTADDGVNAPVTGTFTITVAPPAWRSLGAADLHVLDRRTSGFATPSGSRIELSSFTAWAIRGLPGHVLLEWGISRGSLAPAPRTWRDCRLGIRFDDSDDYNRYHLKAGWFETRVARPLPAPYGPSASVETPPFLDVWNVSSTVLRAVADLRPDTLLNAPFVKRAGATGPDTATMVNFDGHCNNYVLSENASGQLVIQPGDDPGGSDHRSEYWEGDKSPYPVRFPSR